MADWSILIWLAGIAALLFRGPYIYFMFYLLLMVWLIPPILLRKAEEQLTISREIESDAMFFGERMKVKLKIENNSKYPVVWLKINEAFPRQIGPKVQSGMSWVISLKPNETRVLEYSLFGSRRGAYLVGPTKLELGDLFGLYKRELEVQLFDYVTVYPRVRPLEELGVTSTQPLGNLRHPQKIYEDPLKIKGLRDYQAGDPPKRISWKSSARHEKLMVKEYEATMTLDTMIILDLDSNSYHPGRYENTKELGITVAASLSAYLDHKNQALGLATNGVAVAEASAFSDFQVLDSLPLDNITPKKGQGKKILEILARIEGTQQAEPFLELASRVKARLPWGATVILIVPRDSRELITFSQVLIESGFKVVIITTEGTRYREYLGRSSTSSLLVYQVREEDEISALERKREA